MKTLITDIKQLEEYKNCDGSYDWNWISMDQNLSEDFIREFKDSVNWDFISKYQDLSLDFIRKFQNSVNWYMISMYQVLSLDFIKEFKHSVDWFWIIEYQNLSEDFIREFQELVDWDYISKFQVLSLEIIREFQELVNWERISKYQNLSLEFINEFNLDIPENNWNYVSDDHKIKKIEESGRYTIEHGYVYGYKTVRNSMRSVHDNRVKYVVGSVINDWHCDSNCNDSYSFGLGMWNKDGALGYHSDGVLLKIRSKISDVKALTSEGKIRCMEIEILEVVG